MPAPTVLEVNDQLSIPLSELDYRATRSGGPGGQHVNTSASRVEVVWDVAGSRALNDDQREWLMMRLKTRLDSEGKLRLVASDRRSQLQNKESATERLREVVARALVVPKKRKKSGVPRAEKARRLEAKRRRSEIKSKRRSVKGDE
ncbi:MAG TPA: alternative ribosome rescue aminoacyl-tRNA hydrolase ArfB [Gemmatimonadales bacterium]|nr:alternative ribosome rescue aminoacyl-tRNA hydrolase ArfB [Gemmatimonadales bacterium]